MKYYEFERTPYIVRHFKSCRNIRKNYGEMMQLQDLWSIDEVLFMLLNQ